MTADPPDVHRTDRVVELTVGAIAHGGHCVARHEGRVVFVRHALPGERVRVQVDDTGHDRYWRGDAVEVLEPSPDRVTPPCPVAGPGLCGGCDFQHVAPAAQRRLKATVVAEQLERLAGLEAAALVATGVWSGEVEPLPDPPDAPGPGLGWRTRMRYRITPDGRAGLLAHRSHSVVPLPPDGCRLAVPELAVPELAVPGLGAPTDVPTALPTDVPGPDRELVGVRPADHSAHWLDPAAASRGAGATVTERAAGRDFAVRADGFWQVHPAAAELLQRVVLDGLAPQPGESALDLYCGVGLFAAGLLDRGCRGVTGVESSRAAAADARVNLGNGATVLTGQVERLLDRDGGPLDREWNLVVLDPPRTGAGRRVVRRIVRRAPRAVAYVACDPAALARDLAWFAEGGYRLRSLRGFDLFPMTQHVECVAILDRD